MENVKIKINIKTFLIYEKITNQSFNHIDYSNPDNLGTLLYSCFIANNDYKLTQDSFNSFISNNKKFADKITTAFQEEIEFTKQFTSKPDDSFYFNNKTY